MPAQNIQNSATDLHLKFLSLSMVCIKSCLVAIPPAIHYPSLYKAGFHPSMNVRDNAQLIICSSSFVQGSDLS